MKKVIIGIFFVFGLFCWTRPSYAWIPGSAEGKVEAELNDGSRIPLPGVKIYRLDFWNFSYCGGERCWGVNDGVQTTTGNDGTYHLGNDDNNPGPICYTVNPGGHATRCPAGPQGNVPEYLSANGDIPECGANTPNSNWCGFNCGSNPHKYYPYFPAGYHLPGNLEGLGYTIQKGNWTPGEYSEGFSNNENKPGKNFLFIFVKPPTPTPPPPTATPIPPTATPVPPTPTPIQPTTKVSIPLAQAQSFSDDRKSKLGQSWICIESIPCSQEGVSCSGGDKTHRVRIQTKAGTTLKMNSAPTYVFECISPDQLSYRCTTGIDSLDQSLISKSNLPGLVSEYGYRFISYTNTQNAWIDQTIANSVPKTREDGTFGPYEWESKTDIQVGRLMMSMQDLDGTGNADRGSVGALQQATFSFTADKFNKDCVIIKWDPQGIIYDIDSLNPIEDAKVTLLVKNAEGKFVLMEDKKWGLLANPVLSSQKGDYQFFVPAGTYKLEVEKDGYELVTDKNKISEITKINHIYNGREIVTKGEIQEINLLMRKKTILNILIDSIKLLFDHR